MTATEILLLYSPREAIVMMLNSENLTHFPVDAFEFGAPVVVSGRQTRVRMQVRPSRHKLDEVPESGEFDFVYNRLELADHFEDVLVGYETTLPTSTQVLLDELKRRLGQHFFDDDVVLEEVGRSNAAPYRLRAKAESLRWVGELEVHLAEEQDLPTFFSRAILSNGSTRLGQLNSTPQLRSAQLFSPYTNATNVRHLVAQIVQGNYAQDQAGLLAFVRATVAAPNQPVVANNPWVVQSTPAALNLFNARMPALPVVVSNHPLNPNFTHQVTLALDTTYTLGVADSTLTIPYRVDDFATSTFTNTPRLTRYSVKSLSNGTAFNLYLNALEEGYVFQSLDGISGPFLINGPTPYVTHPTAPSHYNLYDAVVVYNGQPRINDIEPADPTLNRILIMALSELNTAYRGNFTVHYRAPIVLPATIPTATLNQAYTTSLIPEGGQAPYTFALIDGSLPTGITLNTATGILSGTSVEVGTFRFTVSVRDQNDVLVVYHYALGVQVGILSITGYAPEATANVPYDFTYAITGGTAPYTVDVVQGALPVGLTLASSTGRLYGTVNAFSLGLYSWTIRVTDRRGITVTHQDTVSVGA